MNDRPLILILGNEYDQQDHNHLFPEVRRLGAEIIRVHPDELTTMFIPAGTRFFVHGRPIRPDLVLGWVYEDILLRGMSQLESLARAGVPVINSARTLFCGQNKYLNSAMLHAAGVNHLPVLSGRDGDALERWAEEQGYPLVLKPIVGFGGHGVQRIESRDDLIAHVRRIQGSAEHYYVQPFVRNPGRDIRVLCVNYQAVVAIYRYAREGGWITNTVAGGRPRPAPLVPAVAKIAEDASRAVGALVSGVDVVEDLATGELRIFEVNTCPSSEPNFSLMNRRPVALYELASFLVAASRDFQGALRSWRAQRFITPDRPGIAA
ncbi:ATP-grasp domain-containing protein [Sorangium sp. So ce375]|uniref:ATP-grasp domain-containing protein n=1 Tax=Sorangium sp. So ce375 TaxID=3133306 RepID=UPI003F5C3616